MFAISLSTLMLGIPVAIDVNTTLSVKSKMQDSLDTAVITAAQNASEDDFIVFGENAYDLNLSEGRLARSSVRIEKQKAGDSDKMVGTATGSLNLIFSGILKKSAMDITVRSVVDVAPILPQPCTTALIQTDTSGIRNKASTTMSAPECEMHVPTKSTNAMNANSKINIE